MFIQNWLYIYWCISFRRHVHSRTGGTDFLMKRKLPSSLALVLWGSLSLYPTSTSSTNAWPHGRNMKQILLVSFLENKFLISQMRDVSIMTNHTSCPVRNCKIGSPRPNITLIFKIIWLLINIEYRIGFQLSHNM